MIPTQLPSAAKTFIGSVSEGLLVPQQTNLGEYVAGLITSEEGSGAKIAQDAIDSKDDSTIAHFLRDAPWDPAEVNQNRIKTLQNYPQTRTTDAGVFVVDDTIIDKMGKKFEGVSEVRDSQRKSERGLSTSRLNTTIPKRSTHC